MLTIRGVASFAAFCKKKVKSYTNIYMLPDVWSQFRKKVWRNCYLL